MASLQQGSGGGNSNRIVAVAETPPPGGDWAAGNKEFGQEEEVQQVHILNSIFLSDIYGFLFHLKKIVLIKFLNFFFIKREKM